MQKPKPFEMKLIIGFKEISDYVEKNYGRKISVEQLSDKEIKVAYEQKILFKYIRIPVNVLVEQVSGAEVTLSLSGNMGIDMVVVGLLAFIRETMTELNGVMTVKGKRVTLDLLKLEKTKNVLSKLNLTDMRFSEDSMEIEAVLL